jgi:hypothetical protein
MELNKKLQEENENLKKRNLLKSAFVDTMEPKIILEALEGSSWRLIMQIGGEVLCNFQKESVLTFLHRSDGKKARLIFSL